MHAQQWSPVTSPLWFSRALVTNEQVRELSPAALGPELLSAEPAELGCYRALELASGIGADLPSWYEWEIAMRGPQPFNYPWGDQLDVSKLKLRYVSYRAIEMSYRMQDAGRPVDEETVVLLESFGEYALTVSPFGL